MKRRPDSYQKQFMQDCARIFNVALPEDLNNPSQLRRFVLACIGEAETWDFMETSPRELYFGLKCMERSLAYRPTMPALSGLRVQILSSWMRFLAARLSR